MLQIHVPTQISNTKNKTHIHDQSNTNDQHKQTTKTKCCFNCAQGMFKEPKTVQTFSFLVSPVGGGSTREGSLTITGLNDFVTAERLIETKNEFPKQVLNTSVCQSDVKKCFKPMFQNSFHTQTTTHTSMQNQTQTTKHKHKAKTNCCFNCFQNVFGLFRLFPKVTTRPLAHRHNTRCVRIRFDCHLPARLAYAGPRRRRQ